MGMWRSFIKRFLCEKSCLGRHSVGPVRQYRYCQLSLQGPKVKGAGQQGSTPALKSDPLHYAHLLWSSTSYVLAERYCVDSTRIHPKMGSMLRSLKDGLGQQVSPLMSPFAQAKPKVQALWFDSSRDQHPPHFTRNLSAGTPQNQYCYGCGQEGHWLGQCPEVDVLLNRGTIVCNESGRLCWPDGNYILKDREETLI